MSNNQLSCFICGYSWKSKHKEHDPKVCPACGNANWKTPSLAVRFLAAWRGFQNPHLVRKVTRRSSAILPDAKPECCPANTPPTPGCCPETPALTGTAADGEKLPTDRDGMPYTARLI